MDDLKKKPDNYLTQVLKRWRHLLIASLQPIESTITHIPPEILPEVELVTKTLLNIPKHPYSATRSV